MHADVATGADGQLVLARTVNYTATAIIARLRTGKLTYKVTNAVAAVKGVTVKREALVRGFEDRL